MLTAFLEVDRVVMHFVDGHAVADGGGHEQQLVVVRRIVEVPAAWYEK